MDIIAFFAHPDDETMLIGGTLALMARQGVKVHYISATRGEGGETGEPPLTDFEHLGEVREQELVCAVQALGGASLTFFDYIDPRVGPDNTLYPYASNLTVLAGQVAISIRQHQPAAVITHGSNGEYGHPAHLLTHMAARVAVESIGEGAPALYTAAAMYPGHPYPRLANKDDPADIIIDVRTALPQKLAAAQCHHTQHALFVRHRSKEAGRLVSVEEAVTMNPQESLRRLLPERVEGGWVDPLMTLLEGSLVQL